ncbi:hypothetical protein RRF57_008519 [Xylaria bambusicola]|uniref:Uncharacterized protein n=1 Tax=Xylaria bambusicola TaxID=326684 RepID=A0AAN7UU21_9PEZI
MRIAGLVLAPPQWIAEARKRKASPRCISTDTISSGVAVLASAQRWDPGTNWQIQQDVWELGADNLACSGHLTMVAPLARVVSTPGTRRETPMSEPKW